MSWRTSLAGALAAFLLAAPVVWPQYAQYFALASAVAVGAGFIASKDAKAQ